MAFLMESIFLSQTEKNKDKLLDILSHYYIQILREEKSQKVVASNNLFGALLCVGEHYPYIVDKPACRQYIIDTVNRVRPLLNYYALNNKLGLFCGLGDFGVALSSINRSTGLYSNLLNSINTTISMGLIQEAESLNHKIKNHSLSAMDYDCILGITGTLRYLLMFDTKMYNEAIIDAIESLITLSGQSYRDGILLPNFHVKNENVLPLEDRGKFPTGMINFGMAHGMAAALSVLSISKKMGISLKGQEKAIKQICDIYMQSYAEMPDGRVYWPSSLTGDDYIHLSNLSPVVHLRLSWCYGAVAILHSLYLAAQALENQELVFWTLEKAKIFSKTSLEYTQLSSPTICHGYAGLLLTFEAFYRDTNDNVFSNMIETLQSKLLALYSPLHKYGFLDVDRVNGKLKKTEGINFLTGTSGVILALSSHYYDSSMVLRHLLLN